jgi:hypothetical protein
MMGRLAGEVAIVTGAVGMVLTHFVKTVPLGGDLAGFLASGESKYITGQGIVIDGGKLVQRKR